MSMGKDRPGQREKKEESECECEKGAKQGADKTRVGPSQGPNKETPDPFHALHS